MTEQDLIYDFFPGIVYIYDTGTGHLSFVSKRVSELLGYSAEDVLSWKDDWMQLVFKDDVAFVRKELAYYAGLKNNETRSFQARYNRKGDTWRYFRTHGNILKRDADGKPLSILFIALDITDQLRSEEELRKSRELSKEVETMLEFGTWDWDFSEGRFERSAGVYAILGYDESISATVRTLSEAEQYEFYMGHIVPEDRPRVDAVIQKAIREKKDYEVEYRIRLKTGEEKVIHGKAKTVAGDDGNIAKIIGAVSDVTGVIRHQQEIESYLAELARSNKELEEFAYVASHDLQEPLRKIVTFSDRLLAKFGPVLGNEGIAYLSRMTVATENMRILIDNLLEFSRISRSEEVFAPTDLNRLLEDAKAEMELKIEEAGALIEQEALPTIVCNGPQVRQLFVNLLGNSLKFRKTDVFTRIHIGCKPVPGGYEMTVSDNGIGFEREYADRIFLIFQRLHGKSEYPGSGVGLAICKKIVDQHGGVITADSTPGNGSVFTVFLPAQHT
ncbi:sensor histidine kinase [Dinghuibacter silviterrae]|uniref:histidine kinase n=1 Tax=Dinghuibacter silviterrae TaxID=1539049 RepID=A0A4R8DP70_9BACT|nr:PAS domain-containing protein [Dinghuibacter silviterrae]TDW99497.1 PAS domain S-box-containing protein [Dinghuibacter silviterrae]